jgi:cyanophycin synthetase
MTVLNPAPQWRMIQGSIFGLAQPSLFGQMTVDLSQELAPAQLDDFMHSLMPVAHELAPVAPGAAALLERVAFWVGEVQRQARIAISMQAHVAPLPQAAGAPRAVFEMALPGHRHRATVATLKWVVKAANHWLVRTPAGALPAPAPALAEELAELMRQLKPAAEPGLNLYPQLMAAYRLGIPVTRIAGRIVRLGTGTQARLLESSISDKTPALGMMLARDKWLSTRLLRALGLPGTDNERVSSADQAVHSAQTLGYPVVVKPADQDQGRGVVANLRNEAGVRAAYAAAAEFSKNILVEKHVEGFGHRFTLCEGELIAVSKRIPGGVVGDGRHDIVALLALQLQDPIVRRSFSQGRVELDDEARSLLSERGLSAHSVPAAGDFVLLRRRDNISAGGRVVHQDLALIHPDNTLLAQRAAKALVLDVAGVDILCPDITRSWREVGGAICEVNARPQFGPGRGGSSHERMLGKLMGGNARIAVHLYLCDDQADATLLARLQGMRRELGLAALSCAQGVWLGDIVHSLPFADGSAAARAALADRDVPSLLMALTPREVLAAGLPIDRLDALHVALSAPSAAADHALHQQTIAWCGVPAALARRAS